MARDNHPKRRQQARDLRRNAAKRAPFERILIVCEGEKTEPNYFREIQREYRLSTANVQVWPSAHGTEPIQVVSYAEHLFLNGDRSKAIEPRAFDRVVAVFDRDQHQSYFNALQKAASLDGRLTNDDGTNIPFHAIASVPCFELWLLLHFENVQAPIHRTEVYERLKNHLPNYDKGQGGHWAATKHELPTAVSRAQARAAATNAYDGNQPFTAVHELVQRLMQLKG